MVDAEASTPCPRCRKWLHLVLGLAALLAGCASPSTYLQRRGADLGDVVDLELTVGPGVDLHAHATRWFGTALGWSDQRGFLVHGRHAGSGSRETFGILVGGFTEAALDDLPPGACAGRYRGEGGGWALLLAAPPDELNVWPESGLSVWDFGIGGSLIVGVHVGFNPAELLDFVAGFSGADLGRDDEPPGRAELTAAGEEEPQAKGESRFGWTPLHEAVWGITGLVYYVLRLGPEHI